MLYNLYISIKNGRYNLFGLSAHKLQKVIDAYLNGEKTVTINGTKCIMEDTSSLRIFQHDVEQTPEAASDYYLNNINFRKKEFNYSYLPPRTLLLMGKEVTDQMIQDNEYGIRKQTPQMAQEKYKQNYVNEERLKELRGISNGKFDFSKLVKLCEELNSNYANENYLSVGMIGRTILNHVPPVFNLKTFEEVASNYGGLKDHKSFKKSMHHLNDSLKNIADSYLHLQIRKRETLPNDTQVNFKQDMDLLLAEIIRISE